jgi:hypothetical protein
MNAVKLFIMIGISCFFVSSVDADIYQWVDREGVRHFTNHPPPEDAGVVIRTDELAHDAAEDEFYEGIERQVWQELSQLALAEREAGLKKREAEVKQKLIEAERRAEEMLREAERYAEEEKTRKTDHIRYAWFPASVYPTPHLRCNPRSDEKWRYGDSSRRDAHARRDFKKSFIDHSMMPFRRF